LLISGGPHITANIPKHVRVVRLPELQMDTGFKGLFSPDPSRTLDQIKAQRQKDLFALFENEKPDLFLIELYPFGRKAFRFELDPVLEAVRNQTLSPCGVVCSVRDILVEKEDQQKHEGRAVDTLNRFFDAVLVHSDPELIRIDETFFRFAEIKIPVIYTGFIAQHPVEGARERIRYQLGLDEKDVLIVASAGGGSVGTSLLESVVKAFRRLQKGVSNFLRVYTGPYIAKNDFESLKRRSDQRVSVEKFSFDFISYMAAADLSISMAGYNTSMNLLATKIPALVWPFPQNQEQKIRANRLARLGALKVLSDRDLAPERLSLIIEQVLSQKSHMAVHINLDGAANTAQWLERWSQREPFA
jgi:predicted glycosyltransferase